MILIFAPRYSIMVSMCITHTPPISSILIPTRDVMSFPSVSRTNTLYGSCVLVSGVVTSVMTPAPKSFVCKYFLSSSVTGGVGIGGSLFTGTSTADSISGVVLNNGVITTGSWSATAITAFYGGTGNTSYTLGDLLVGAGSTFIKLPVGINSYVLGADSSSTEPN